MINVIVTLCHLAAAQTNAPAQTACFERVAGTLAGTIEQCPMLQAGIADWLGKSMAYGDDYYVKEWRCEYDPEKKEI